MTKYHIINECVEIIDNHEESDCECYRVGYYLSYKDGKISFRRSTTSPTGETFSDGGIATNTYVHPICEWDATIEDYTNIAILFANRDIEDLKHKYGYNVEYIQFTPIL